MGQVKNDNDKKSKTEEAKFCSLGIHPSGKLGLLGNSGGKSLDIVDLSNEKIVASKKLRGKGKKNALDVPNFVEFTEDGSKMIIFSEPNTLRLRGMNGDEIWKVNSELKTG